MAVDTGQLAVVEVGEGVMDITPPTVEELGHTGHPVTPEGPDSQEALVAHPVSKGGPVDPQEDQEGHLEDRQADLEDPQGDPQEGQEDPQVVALDLRTQAHLGTCCKPS